MKTWHYLIIVVIILQFPVKKAFAQAEDRIRLGTAIFHIGMTYEEVEKQVEKNLYGLHLSGGESYFVYEGEGYTEGNVFHAKILGTVIFKKNKLSAVVRQYYSGSGNLTDMFHILESFFKGVENANNLGFKLKNIRSQHPEGDGWAYNMEIIYNKRLVILRASLIQGDINITLIETDDSIYSEE